MKETTVVVDSHETNVNVLFVGIQKMK